MLDELNQFDNRGPVRTHEDAGEFAYSDGPEAERYLKSVLEQAEDLSSTSVELESAILDWATEYHLSSKRANLLRGLGLRPGTRVLEVGCGCGAITRYLGEQGLSVDAIEGSSVRAELAHLRCRGLSTVNVYCANFNDLTLPADYDIVCLIGVAEYAARFMDSTVVDRPIVSLLEKVRDALKPDGSIIIAIENRSGLKYMMGAHEDHFAQKFIGIHNYFGRKDINTYTLTEWQEIFATVDLSADAVYLPFPDYKLPTVLLAQDYVNENQYAFCHLDGIESRDYVDRFKPGVRESLLWQAASAAWIMDRLSNSFLFVASRMGRTDPHFKLVDFIHLPDFRRRREYCALTYKPRGDDTVRRRKLVDIEPVDEWISQKISDESYHSGTLLSVEWARALEIESDGARFIKHVSDYVSYMRWRNNLTIDLTPANIVVNEQGDYIPFDEEWLINDAVDADFLLFRSLLIFVVKSRNAVYVYSKREGLRTVGDFVLHIGDRVGVDLNARMHEHIELEERFQNTVAINRDTGGTNQFLESELRVELDPVVARVYWRMGKGSYSEEHSIVRYVEVTDDRQKIVFMLPPSAATASYIRFDPCDDRRGAGVGFMRIYGVNIRAVKPKTGHKKVVWALNTPETIAHYAKSSGLRYGKSGLGWAFMVTDDDPWMEFEFVPRIRLSGSEYLEVEIEMTIPYSGEYLLARDQHLTEADRLEEAARNMDDFRTSYRYLEKELENIKSSRFWTLFKRYVRLRRRTNKVTGKLRLWYAFFRNLGYRRGLARLYRAVENRARGLLKRKPDVSGPPTKYEIWRDKYLRRDTRPVTDGPLLSVVMPVHNVAGPVLEKAIRSVQKQLYPNWELCIADDASTRPDTRAVLTTLKDERIKICFLEENLNISGATNAAVEMATGRYLAFMDNDDELADDALNAVASIIVSEMPDLLYTDEDFINPDGHLDDPHFKTDYNPDLLLSHNYITHLLVLSRSLFERVGGFRSEYDGAQDYDLVLRAVEQAEKIIHVPRPVYHWRKSQGSTSLNPLAKTSGHDNARKALAAALERRRIQADVEDTALPHFFRVRRALHDPPRVTVIVPFRDKPALLRACIESVLEKSTYSDFEVLGISNDSINSQTYVEMKRLRALDRRVVFRELNTVFNFSELINFGVEWASGDHIVLLNNDIEIISADWLEGLLEHSQRSEVAAVGAKLYYPNNRIQHAGLGIGLGGYAGHLHKNFRADSPGYFNRLNIIQNISAVTGALMMVEKSVYEKLGGFDEERFSIAYNDVDFCLRAREAGYLNVFTPFVQAYHQESASRGYEETAEKRARFQRECSNLKERYGAVLERGDPYYNPNFDQERDDFRLPLTMPASG